MGGAWSLLRIMCSGGLWLQQCDTLCSATREFINKIDLIYMDYEDGRCMELTQDCVQW